MSFRPLPARWFELVTTKAHVAQALEALALSGAVELEVRRAADQRLLLPDLGDLLRAYHAMARAYASYWPDAEPVAGRSGEPRALLERAWRNLNDWRGEADPAIAQSETLARERRELILLREALARIGDGFPDPKQLADAGPRLAAALIVLPHSARLPDAPMVLPTRWDTPEGAYLLIVGPREGIGELVAQVPALKGQIIPLPAWLPPTVPASQSAIDERLAQIGAEFAAVEAELARLARKHALAEALGDFHLFEWLSEHANDIGRSARLAYVTGWSSDGSGASLQQALDERSVSCLLRLPPAPPDAEPPLLLANPRWARGFEMFARMLGMPARTETDPSLLVAFVAPLLFGFMFGDVGQGLVLMAVGLFLGARLPVLKLLVPGGAMAMLFGLLFGSVFCSEHVIPALWLNPLERPVDLLAVTLAFGVGLISLGLALAGVQAHWRGEGRRWLMHEAGLAVAYFAILASFRWPQALWMAGAGALWFVAGGTAIARGNWAGAAGRTLAELAEQLIQLLVNTVSFARVGAFALAHAGLSAAVIGVADALGGVGYGIVLLLGNMLVLTLEGLVVGIQTTRLMLFEFFIRFLKGGGRAFRPLAPPARGWLPPANASEPQRT